MIVADLTYKVNGKTQFKHFKMEGYNDYVLAIHEIFSQLSEEFDTMDIDIPTLHMYKTKEPKVDKDGKTTPKV